MSLLVRLRSFWSTLAGWAEATDYDQVGDLSDRVRRLELRLDELTGKPSTSLEGAEPMQR